MKILFFSHQAKFIYGGEICTMAFMRELKFRGQEIYFSSPSGPYFERVNSAGVKSFIAPSIEFQRKPKFLFSFPLAWWKTFIFLKEICEREGIDLLHATSLKSLVYLWSLGIFSKQKVVWHHHDILPASFMNDFIVRILARAAKIILVPSNATGEALVKSGIAKKKIETLYNGFNEKEWTKRNWSEKNSPFIITMLGEISRRKGSDLIAPMISKVKKELKQPFVFWIIGAGLSDSQFAEKIREENAEFEKQGLIKFFGRREDIKDLLQETDLLIVPSRQDPLPTVIIEAYLSGVPALGSLVGGIPEMISHGETGYLCRASDDFAEKIVKLAQDRERLRRMADSARSFAEKKFSILKNTDRLLDLYQRCLAR